MSLLVALAMEDGDTLGGALGAYAQALAEKNGNVLAPLVMHEFAKGVAGHGLEFVELADMIEVIVNGSKPSEFNCY